jgi:hypothetical protein
MMNVKQQGWGQYYARKRIEDAALSLMCGRVRVMLVTNMNGEGRMNVEGWRDVEGMYCRDEVSVPPNMSSKDTISGA